MKDEAIYYSDLRAEDNEILKDILSKEITHVLYCAGRTHGKTYNTIDYLEDPSTLYENINDNLYGPLHMALFCDKHDIHMTYIGTGCIFTYDEEHTIENKKGFTEEDKPNFFGSNYSIVKGFTDMLMHKTNVLNLRIRMPISLNEEHPRNFITKIKKYDKIYSIPNSMTILDNIIPIIVKMIKNKEIGTFNMTNPGTFTHKQILDYYNLNKEYINKDEINKIIKADRSNNYLDTTKLESKYKVNHTNEFFI